MFLQKASCPGGLYIWNTSRCTLFSSWIIVGTSELPRSGFRGGLARMFHESESRDYVTGGMISDLGIQNPDLRMKTEDTSLISERYLHLLRLTLNQLGPLFSRSRLFDGEV
jgi:hypothetical protein